MCENPRSILWLNAYGITAKLRERGHRYYNGASYTSVGVTDKQQNLNTQG